MTKSSMIAIASITINFSLLFFCLYTQYKEAPTLGKQQIVKEKTGTAFKVAIFEPAPHPAIDEISNGFKQTLEDQGTHPYDFKIFNANGNKTLQRSQADEIVHGNYDLIFTIGAGCTQIIKELTTKKDMKTPVVFSAVDNPVGMGLVNSLTSSGNHLTGVINTSDYKKQLAILPQLKPSTRSVLLVYDPGHGTGLEKDKNEIEQILSSYNISLQAAPVYNAGEIQQKVEGLMSKSDVVLILTDNTVVSALDGLVRLCNRYGVTLFASDLNSGLKGAALACGVTEAEYGTESGKKALLILEQNQSPTSIPTIPLSSYHLTINTTTMHQQNLILNPTLTFLLQSTKFVKMQGENV